MTNVNKLLTVLETAGLGGVLTETNLELPNTYLNLKTYLIDWAEEGKDEGYSEGYSDGRSDGYDEGYEEGREAGRSENEQS